MEGKDGIPTSEVSSFVDGYCGTTIANYALCAYVGTDGLVYFDKQRDSRHHNSNQISFTLDPAMGIYWALGRARETNSIPLVLYGHIPVSSILKHRLMKDGEHFPVNSVLLPRPEIDWRNISRAIRKKEVGNDLFDQADPLEILFEAKKKK